MSKRLFCVELSEAARDFQATATEPGLAMLDRNGANYAILRRWLGDYVAEPEWQGQTVSFYVRDEQQGRMDNLHCIPCTKADMLGPLKDSLEEMDQRLRKARPESSTEQLLHKIVRQQFNTLTKDYDASDFHCHFFKFRQRSEPWRLIWCWGYQRSDLEPGKSLICGNRDCEALYVKRPRQKARCPVCASSATRGKAPAGTISGRMIGLAALLLLLVLGALFLLMNQPRLVVTPDQWTGPPGSRVNYNIEHRRWYFFRDDITDQAVPQSHDRRVIAFGHGGNMAKARAMGQTFVTFRFKNLAGDATVKVTEPLQPQSISLVPDEKVRLAIGSTKQLKLLGHYDELDDVDLTELAEWESRNTDYVFVHHGLLEGTGEGQTEVTARYRANKEESYLDASVEALVTKVDYKSLELAVAPAVFGSGQSGRIEAWGLDAKGEKYSLLGSSLLKLNVAPQEAAEIEGDYLVGKEMGKAQLAASLHDLQQTTEFEVIAASLADGTFSVTPEKVTLSVDEYVSLDVVTASTAPITAVSSNADVVQVLDFSEIAGRAPGTAKVTLTQGDKSQTIDVTVTESNIVSLHIDPPAITLASGVATPIRVYARTTSGGEIQISPDRLTWVKQPPLDYADLNRQSLELFGITPTGEQWPLVVQLGESEALQATAMVTVVGSSLASTTVVDLGGDEFMVYPPLPFGGGQIVLPDGLVYRDGHVYVGDVGRDSAFYGIPSGTRIDMIGDQRIVGWDGNRIAQYFHDYDFLPGTVIHGSIEGGAVRPFRLGREVLVLPVQAVEFRADNVSASTFDAALSFAVERPGEYRLTDQTGQPLSEWQAADGNSLIKYNAPAVSRNESAIYNFIVERKIDGLVVKFPFSLELKSAR